MEKWEDTRRRARTLETDIDNKLIAFNRLSISQVLSVLVGYLCSTTSPFLVACHVSLFRTECCSAHGRARGADMWEDSWRREGLVATEWWIRVDFALCRTRLLPGPGLCRVLHQLLLLDAARHYWHSSAPCACTHAVHARMQCFSFLGADEFSLAAAVRGEWSHGAMFERNVWERRQCSVDACATAT